MHEYMVFTPLAGEKILETLKPQKLAFLSYFLVLGFFTVIGIIVAFFLWWLGLIFLIFGILGIVMTTFYMKAFTYYLTNKRIFIYKRFITISSRQVQYDDLSDVVVHQGIFGRIFGFGNVIPITKSGLGLGYRGWQTGVGYGVGRTTGPIVIGGPVGGETVPVATPGNCIYGIREPFRIKDLIFKHQEEYAEAPYLKRIAEKITPAPGEKVGAMLFCPFCGSKLEVQGADFCSGCGKRIRPSRPKS